MATRISTSARNAAADAVVDLLDAGSGAGYIEIRTGSQPATPNTAATGTTVAPGAPAYYGETPLYPPFRILAGA